MSKNKSVLVRGRRGAGIGVASLTALVLALSTSPVATAADGAGDEPSDRRGLQSVQVSMTSAGSIDGMRGRLMRPNEDGTGIDSTETDFDPQEDADELPVRVLTSYTTDEGSGTDLAEIDGYDGRVEIELTVSNLTGTAQQITFDAGGSQERNAEVYAPLTVVGAADLGRIDPATVVTDSPTQQSLLAAVSGQPSGSSVTNGVLGRTDAGDTVVQWAAILAPPRLPATTRLRLVLDGEDLQAPEFDLTVFPGLVVDPSLGELLDTAFNPERSQELQLQGRTIEVIGDVNEVLGQASGTIADVRTTLSSAAETLGRKTVSDLRSATGGIATSIRGLQGTLRALRSGVSGSVRSSSQGTLAQLDQTIGSLQRILGSTRARIPAVSFEGTGCEARVGATSADRSVYGRLLRVVALLDGYARTTDACKAAVQRTILASVGPAEPDAEKCLDADGRQRKNVTCSLLGVQSRFGEISTQLLADGEAAIKALDPDLANQAELTSQQLSVAVDLALQSAEDLLGENAFNRGGSAAENLGGALGGVNGVLNRLGGDLSGLSTRVQEGAGNANVMSQQVSSLLAQVCSVAGPQASEMKRILDGGTCAAPPPPPAPPAPPAPDGDAGTGDGDTDGDLPDDGSAPTPDAGVLDDLLPGGPGGGGSPEPPRSGPSPDSLADRVARDVAAWGALSASIGSAFGSLGSLEGALNGVGDSLDDVKQGLKGDQTALKDLTDALEAAMKDLDEARGEVVDDVAEVADNQDVVTAAARQAFAEAAADSDAKLARIIDPAVRQVSDSTITNVQTLGRAFDKSTQGLRRAGGLIFATGRNAIQRQQQVLLGARRDAQRQISRQTDQALRGIDAVVSASVRDLSSASAVLRRDLTNVLLDLGDPDVEGSGLLGIMATGAARARAADLQLTLATDKTTSYANQRSQDVTAIKLRQAQADASLQRLQQLGAFGQPELRDVQTVYDFHIGSAPQ